MKKVDIREIGKTIVIDMNTLSDKAYSEVDKLTTAYYQLKDYKNYLWKNNKLIIDDENIFNIHGSNEDEMHKVWIELETIELDLYRIIKDSKNFKGFSFKKLGNLILDASQSKWYWLFFASVWGIGYVDFCLSQNIVGALCSGYLVMQYTLDFNAKRILEIK